VLRLDKDGAIRLTIKGEVVATLDRIAVRELTAAQLVQWENHVRLDHYERSKGFYCSKNQRDSREVEISARRLEAYPLAEIQPLDDFNAHWEGKRDSAIDN